MSQVRQIAQLGEEVLRRQASRVGQFDSPNIQALISDLFTTLADTNGVGIAAPQISESWRIIIIASRPSHRYPHAPNMLPVLMINPSFEPLSDHKEKDWEGCLSIPGIRAKVPRFTEIKVSYTGKNGKTVEQNFEGFLARVFQHEYDHLEGRVYLDHVEDNRDIISEAVFNQLMEEVELPV